jgi:hypothetical protein
MLRQTFVVLDNDTQDKDRGDCKNVIFAQMQW